MKLPVNQIICGDTLEVLKTFPLESIDLGITSPPYNKGEKHKGWLVKNVKYDKASDKLPEEEYRQQQVDVLNEIYRVTKGGGSFFYNHKTRWERGEMFHPMDWLRKTNWKIRQEIIWDRRIAANIRGWRFWQLDERIYWLYKPIKNNTIGKELDSKHALLGSIWRFSPENNNKHPAPFPIVLPARIIFSILNGQRGIVLDPYAGSGTTCVVAKLMNCDYIGIDISEEYCKMAKDRLLKAEEERTKLQEELKKHVVTKTFSDRKLNGEYTGRYKEDKQRRLV